MLMLLVGVGLLFGLTTGVLAHVVDPGTGPFGEGNPVIYYAGAIPAGQITFDGDLSDWAGMPELYTWTLATAPRKSDAIVAGEIAADDFDVIMYIGWSPSENMLMLGVDVTDDILYVPEESIGATWKEDNLQINLDPDHDGAPWRPYETSEDPEEKDREDSEEGQQLFFTPDEQMVNVFIQRGAKIAEDIGLDWYFQEPYIHMGLKMGSGGAYTLEVGITLFDHLSREGVDASVLHTMQAGDIIGFGFYIKDADSADDSVGMAFHFGDPGGGDATVLGDLMLMSLEDTGWGPTAVESSTWGKIKATFGK
jgi:hypothetical protein